MKFKSNFTWLLSLVFICAFVNVTLQDQLQYTGKLTITQSQMNPSVNKQTFDLTPASYSEHYTNFQKIAIRLIKPSTFDGCTPHGVFQLFPIADFDYIQTFLIVDGRSGDCSYRKKAQLAKQAYAKGIIIIDDSSKQIAEQKYSGFQDGTFFVFLINKKDADKLLDKGAKQFTAALGITKNYNLQKKKNLQIWMSSLNNQSYEMLSWWNQTMTQIAPISNAVTWIPKYVFYGCLNDCQSQYVSGCACGGMFCSPQFHQKSSTALVQQDIRQKLIFQQYPDKFMSYMTIFMTMCKENYIKTKYAEDCSRSIMAKLQIDEQKINGRIQKFFGQCDKDQKLFGQLIQDKGRFSELNQYPTILLNRQILEFKSKAQLQAVLCRKLSLQQNQGCAQIVNKNKIIQILIDIFFFVLILAGLVGVGVLVVICYKNTLRKEMNKQVKMQVSSSVQHYFSLNSAH